MGQDGGSCAGELRPQRGARPGPPAALPAPPRRPPGPRGRAPHGQARPGPARPRRAGRAPPVAPGGLSEGPPGCPRLLPAPSRARRVPASLPLCPRPSAPCPVRRSRHGLARIPVIPSGAPGGPRCQPRTCRWPRRRWDPLRDPGWDRGLRDLGTPGPGRVIPSWVWDLCPARVGSVPSRVWGQFSALFGVISLPASIKLFLAKNFSKEKKTKKKGNFSKIFPKNKAVPLPPQDSVEHCIIGVTILSQLTNEINQADTTHPLTKHRKIASSFRDSSLFDIFTLSCSLLKQASGKNLNLHDESQHGLLMQLLKLTHNCLNFDFIGTSTDESSDDLCTVQIPTSWRSAFLDSSTLQLFFDLYHSIPPSFSPLVLSCLVQIASVRRSLFNNAERAKFLSHLVDGVKRILENPQSLSDPNNYHEFCRLLARLKSNYQLGELVKVENYPEVIRLIANFTVTSLQHWEFAPNSVHYLLSLWQRLAASVPYVKATEPHMLETYTPEVTKAYITSRLESVHIILRDGLEDPLEDTGLVQQQLDQLSTIGRCEYEKTCALLVQLFDQAAQSYQELLQSASASPMDLAVQEGHRTFPKDLGALPKRISDGEVVEQLQGLGGDRLAAAPVLQVGDAAKEKHGSERISGIFPGFFWELWLVFLTHPIFFPFFQSEHFSFLGINNQSNLTDMRCRTTFYTALGRLLMVDLGEDEDQYEQFMLPLTAAFETVAQMFSTNSFNEQEAKRTLVGLVRDLRGIAFAFNAKTTGIPAGNRILTLGEVPKDQVYALKLKGISICFSMLKAALSGSYVNFGVFRLYGDDALDNALQTFIKLLLSIPHSDLLDYPKLSQSYYSLLEVLTQDHMNFIASLEPHVIMYILSSISEGLTALGESCCSLRPFLGFGVGFSWGLDNFQDYFSDLRNSIVNSQPPEKQQAMHLCFENLMEGIERNLLTKNRDRFTQNLSAFRREVNDSMKNSSYGVNSNDMMS
uniref:Exportin 7 n=1 Tax=Junco hyemalis TaxID=40217 RepID=A0A8C5NK18_JUNHY